MRCRRVKLADTRLRSSSPRAGNRVNAYLHVAPQVAAFVEYRYALMEHLLHVKLVHWDRDVRELAAKVGNHTML